MSIDAQWISAESEGKSSFFFNFFIVLPKSNEVNSVVRKYLMKRLESNHLNDIYN